MHGAQHTTCHAFAVLQATPTLVFEATVRSGCAGKTAQRDLYRGLWVREAGEPHILAHTAKVKDEDELRKNEAHHRKEHKKLFREL